MISAQARPTYRHGKRKAILGPASHVQPAGKMYLLFFFVKNINYFSYEFIQPYIQLYVPGHMEKQEMKMETEMENGNGNSCTVVSNHWTGLLDSLKLPLLVYGKS